jgi:hypothetical protein
MFLRSQFLSPLPRPLSPHFLPSRRRSFPPQSLPPPAVPADASFTLKRWLDISAQNAATTFANFASPPETLETSRTNIAVIVALNA